MAITRNIQLTSKFFKNVFNCIANYRAMSTTIDDVLFLSVNNKGVIKLNRPKALNSLNLSMVNKMQETLKQWEKDKALVIIQGTGGKAFCAGGDVKKVAEAGLRGESYGRDFFRREYILNGMIGNYPVPYIALIDGIVMGGGVGVSIHGHYRIATERTLFAMPETRIGLFPDVGGSYFLPRLGSKLGFYLALTGHRLQGSDVYRAGIATHYCNSGDIETLQKALLNECNNNDDIKNVLQRFHIPDTKELSLTPYLDKINEYFSATTVEEIVQSLENDDSEWAKETLHTLSLMSPTSLKVTLRELILGSNMELHECLKMEYRLAVNCLANKDFYEGIRALLVDKDNLPAWVPNRLEQVTDQMVNSYFNKLPQLDELQHKL